MFYLARVDPTGGRVDMTGKIPESGLGPDPRIFLARMRVGTDPEAFDSDLIFYLTLTSRLNGTYRFD